MPERRASLQLALIVCAIALVVGGAILFRTAPEAEPTPAAGEGAGLRVVATQVVRRVPVRSRAEVAGVLEARRSVQIFSETRGSVMETGAEELDRVEAGQLLVKIDPLLAEVAVERAAATVARSRSELALASSHLARRRSLAKRSITSDADLEDAENAEKVAAAALRQSRADLTLARDDLTKKTITASFAGVLRSFHVEVGEYVGEGQKLGELLDLDTARVILGLSDRQIVAVRAGQPVTVTVEAYPEERFDGSILRVGAASDAVSRKRFDGSILRVGAASDAVSRKFPVEVEIPNGERRLLPGMVARVSLDLGQPQTRAVIPREATVDEFGLRFVYRIEEQGGILVARRRRVGVRELPFRPGEFEVLSGLADGDEIALTATRQLRDGEQIQRNGKLAR
jgi:membrane fusion protein (multidrug efflux system)